MQRFCRCAGRGAGRVGRAIVGWFFLVLAVMVTQVAGVWPVVAQAGLASSGAGSSTVLSWGENNEGELGDGTTTNRSTPAKVNLPPGTTITTLAGGGGHSLALVAPPPTSATTLQVTPANPTADQDITLTATVTCNVDTPTGTITLRTNGETLATVPLTTSANHTTTLPTGTHTLTAHHTSTNTCPNSQSPPTTITINPDLPITGPTLTTTGAATLSILAGAILIYAARRRRPAPRHLR